MVPPHVISNESSGGLTPDETNDARSLNELEARAVQPAEPRTHPSGLTHQPMRWARLNSANGAPLRRGAWYPVFNTTSEEVGIIVHGRVIIAGCSSVEVRETPANRWALVTAGAGSFHIVCPQCAERVPVRLAAGLWTPSLTCARCQGTFGVEMSAVTGAGVAPRAADPDLRRRERRQGRQPQRVERRWAKERRASWQARPPLFDDFTTP